MRKLGISTHKADMHWQGHTHTHFIGGECLIVIVLTVMWEYLSGFVFVCVSVYLYI